MRLWILIILVVFLALIVMQISAFWEKRGDEEIKLGETKAALERAKEDQEKLERDFSFYLRPENLEKELRARFNYKLPGEKTIILIPQESNEQP